MWGGLPVSLKIILADVDSLTVTWFRFSVSALIAILWYGSRSAGSIRRLLGPRLLPITLLATGGLLANYILYVLGLDYTTAEAAQMLIQFAPLFLLLGGVFLFKESFSAVQWLGVVALVFGLLLFFHHRLQALATVEASYLTGMLLVILAGLVWAGYGLAQKRLIRHVSANDLLLLIYIAGTLCFLPFSSPAQVLQLQTVGWVALAFASLNTLIAYGSFGYAMTHWEASRVSAIITLAPLLTILLVNVGEALLPGLLESEPLDWLNGVGAVMVVGGSIVAAMGGRSTEPTGSSGEAV